MEKVVAFFLIIKNLLENLQWENMMEKENSYEKMEWNISGNLRKINLKEKENGFGLMGKYMKEKLLMENMKDMVYKNGQKTEVKLLEKK